MSLGFVPRWVRAPLKELMLDFTCGTQVCSQVCTDSRNRLDLRLPVKSRDAGYLWHPGVHTGAHRFQEPAGLTLGRKA